MNIKEIHPRKVKATIVDGEWKFNDFIADMKNTFYGMDVVVHNALKEDEAFIMHKPGWRASESETLIVSPSAMSFLQSAMYEYGVRY